MHKAVISTKSFYNYKHLVFKLMPPGWGSQWILSAPPQPTVGHNQYSNTGLC